MSPAAEKQDPNECPANRGAIRLSARIYGIFAAALTALSKPRPRLEKLLTLNVLESQRYGARGAATER